MSCCLVTGSFSSWGAWEDLARWRFGQKLSHGGKLVLVSAWVDCAISYCSYLVFVSLYCWRGRLGYMSLDTRFLVLQRQSSSLFIVTLTTTRHGSTCKMPFRLKIFWLWKLQLFLMFFHVFPIFSTVYRASVPVSGFSGQVRGQNFGPPSCKRSLDRDVAKTPKGPEQNAQNECPDAPEHIQLSYTETLIFFVFWDISTCQFCQFWQYVSWLHGLFLWLLWRRKTRWIASKAEHWSLSRCGDCDMEQVEGTPNFLLKGWTHGRIFGNCICLGFDTRIPSYSFLAGCILSSYVIIWS